eukprot:3374558-Amphidinium_carterae.1
MNRKIQKNHTNDVSDTSQSEVYYYDSGPLSGLRAGRGANLIYETEDDDEVKHMLREKKTSLSVRLFDMVAELAIAKR